VTATGLAGGIMVCGTGSDSGKSTVVAGLCRLLARRGLRVAPFKAQNMALNSAVTEVGHEIGRAQAAQAAAAGVAPEVAMNPVLLKPTGERTSQVVVMGRPWATLDAAAYQAAKSELWPVVSSQLQHLRANYDAVVCEGAGSPAEINLLAGDITNLRVAADARLPALLVGDIDRGGVFASLFGTVTILPEHLASCVRAFVINKFRGDPALLGPGLEELERRTGVPTIGVLPWMDGLDIDAEDSLALSRLGRPRPPDPGPPRLDVAAVQLPRISNFTDLEALALEPSVRLRLVGRPDELGHPDLLVLPGTKATVADLRWLRTSGLAAAVTDLAAAGRSTVLGVCGGYQMLGLSVEDDVEAAAPAVEKGLGLLPVTTVFQREKVTRRVTGRAMGEAVTGYEIHHGSTAPPDGGGWMDLADGPEGAATPDRAVLGTSVHGLFENDGFRRAFLGAVARRAGVDWEPGPPVSFAAARERQFDRVADALDEHLDIETIYALIKAAAT
jgi:adenosylcobyric acid synthase